jgi:hypothetical protein
MEITLIRLSPISSFSSTACAFLEVKFAGRDI